MNQQISHNWTKYNT